MAKVDAPDRPDPAFEARVRTVFEEAYARETRKTDRMFAGLMLFQWVAAIGVSVFVSPLAWEGRSSSVHLHVYAAIFIGGAISSLPVALAFLQPSRLTTRYAIAIAQVLWSALLIHLSGGRIETHFHVFISLAILAFYRDLKVLVPATIVVAVDHFVRGMVWPESVYGVANPEWWRFLEHAGWVVFMDAFLIVNTISARKELEDLCRRQVEIEAQRERIVSVERLAAIGQLAASVSHELRNPLAAIKNAHTYISRKIASNGADTRLTEMLALMQRELDASNKIIANLLDFSRPRTATPSPTPLRPLVAEAISVVPTRADVEVSNEVPDDLPIPEIDKDQFRQVFVNLVQNGVEAIPPDRPGRVTVTAQGGGAVPFIIEVHDDGAGVSDADIARILEPLYSTKTKGTGLGLSVVAGIIERHGGTLNLESTVGKGTSLRITLPGRASTRPAAREDFVARGTHAV